MAGWGRPPFGEEMFGEGTNIVDADIRIVCGSAARLGPTATLCAEVVMRGAAHQRYGGTRIELPAQSSLRLTPWLRDGG